MTPIRDDGPGKANTRASLARFLDPPVAGTCLPRMVLACYFPPTS